MLRNARFTAFIVSKLLKGNQQGEEGKNSPTSRLVLIKKYMQRDILHRICPTVLHPIQCSCFTLMLHAKGLAEKNHDFVSDFIFRRSLFIYVIATRSIFAFNSFMTEAVMKGLKRMRQILRFCLHIRIKLSLYYIHISINIKIAPFIY